MSIIHGNKLIECVDYQHWTIGAWVSHGVELNCLGMMMFIVHVHVLIFKYSDFKEFPQKEVVKLK